MRPTSVTVSSFEWPTWCVVLAIYGVWVTTVALYQQLPWWLSHALLIFVTAWFMSLQHEVLHGHPTRWRGLNRALVLFPISPWFPFDLYRDSHLAHHQDVHLTLPGIDPESNFVSQQAYAQMPVWRQRLLTFLRSVVGRLTIGSLLSVWQIWSESLGALAKGDRRYLSTWLIHFLLLAALLVWIDWQANMSPLTWLLGVAYPAVMLIVLRSFFEHRAAHLPEHRIVVNESNWFWRLLYLNNNFHAVHHERPGLPWYQIPKMYWADRDGYLRRNGGFYFKGYGGLVTRYLFTPVDTPIHPFASAEKSAQPSGDSP